MKPKKKQGIIAPHIVSLSSIKYDELNKFILISCKIFGVMGVRLGFLYLLSLGPFDTTHCEKDDDNAENDFIFIVKSEKFYCRHMYVDIDER